MSELRKILFLAILLAVFGFAEAQFYNGHQMKFGKNRVQFDNFEWFYFRFERFDTYFIAGSNDVALKTASIANKTISETETFFEHQLKQRIVFIIYQNLSDFRQSNLDTERGDEQYNIGGVTKIVDNVAFLFVEGDVASLEEQIRSAIAQVILNEMLYGVEFTSKVANNTLISMPAWYVDGLLKYVSTEWNSECENLTRNAIEANKFDNLNHLSKEDSEIAGHAIWNYVAKTYGRQVIPNIVYLTRVTKNPESGFLYVLGISLAMLQQNMTDFYKAQYQSFSFNTSAPDGKNILKKSKQNTKYYQFQYSENGQKVAWVQNIQGRYKIKMLDLVTGKKKTVIRREHKLDQITDYSYPLVKWHPSGKLLGFMIEKKGQIYYVSYNLETKEFKQIEMAALEKVNSFDYSHDGLSLVIAGFNNGQSDIFIFNILANTIVNITQDNADDYHPAFVNKSQQIVFASKRKSAEIGSRRNNLVELQKFTDIFVYDIKSQKIEQITETEFVNEEFPDLKNKKYTYLSDENGINNLYVARIDSAVSFVDTITHYRYFLSKSQLTNYPNNIIEYYPDKFGNSSTFLYLNSNKFQLILNDDLPSVPLTSEKTTWRKMFDKEMAKTVKVVDKKKENPEVDTTVSGIDPKEKIVDINNYSFDKEIVKDVKNEDKEFDENGIAIDPRTGRYQTTFYTNYSVIQADFGFLNNSYQTFTGSAFYFNPGFSLIYKVGSYDLFEDYRITGGFRFSGNFDSNEYLLSLENLKNRWNKKLILHRQVLNNFLGNFYVKSYTHEAYYQMRYPLSQVDAFQFTGQVRQNHNAFLATDYPTLIKPDVFDYWAGVKAEYIFDNSKQISINILSGTRFKVFAEAYKQIDKEKSDLFVTGADYRYYKPIHKNLIFAFRAAGSASFGSAKLIYYLGGMDNWINLSSKVPTFNQDIRIDPEINYAYQAVATNLRGFSQNIRNGTNFAVVNAEIRWPVISYLYKRPINNEFLNSFQLIGFFDIGSAWTGLTPFSGDNAYENDYYDNYPVNVIIHNDNFPIVSGYGFGVRSRLFGYFIRADWAWGINGYRVQPQMFYLSLSTDF